MDTTNFSPVAISQDMPPSDKIGIISPEYDPDESVIMRHPSLL